MKYTESEDSLHGVLQELWYNIRSGTITSLRADSRFPSNPDVVNILQQFDAPFNFHTDYGQRLTAYLQVNSSYIIIIFSLSLFSFNVVSKNGYGYKINCRPLTKYSLWRIGRIIFNVLFRFFLSGRKYLVFSITFYTYTQMSLFLNTEVFL